MRPNAILIPLLASAAFAQTLPQTRPVPETDLPAIVQGLASDNFTTRQIAQKQLDTLNYKFRDILARLADQQTDPEVKARLQSRIAAIDEQSAIDPPPISLDIKDATPEQVVAALNKAMGTTITLSSISNGGPAAPLKRWTLSAVDKPFWEVFADLNRQHGWGISNGAGGMVMVNEDFAWTAFVQSGGIAIFPMTIRREATSFPQRQPGAQTTPTKMAFDYMVAIDPRLKLGGYSRPQLAEITDDAGNVLYKPNPEESPRMISTARLPISQFTPSIPLDIPSKLGTKIPSIKGTFTVNILLGQQTFTLENAEKHVGQAFLLAGRVFTLEGFDPAPDHFEMKIGVKNAPDALLSPDLPRVAMKLTDAKGKVHWDLPLSANSVFKNAQDGTPPFKLEFTAPTKTRQVTIPFEFKNLLLP